jgi:aminoglycoside phosphotransferase (APT) family kinase protein
MATLDALNADEILAALGVSGVARVAPVPGGWDTALWQVERADGRRFALRVFRPEQEQTWRREALAMRAAAAGGVPVPQLEREGRWQDRPALLLSWCAGRPLLHQVLARPWRVWRAAVEFGRVQACIHAVPAPAPFGHSDHSWIARAGPEEEALQERLRSLPLQSGHLLHLDYHPLNVLVAGKEITCVLDWANACAGDPRADLARTVTLLRLPPVPPEMPSLLAKAVTAGRRLLEAGWRHGYRREAARRGSLSAIAPAQALFYAWAGAFMVRDLAPKLGSRGVWLQAHDLERMRRWTARWKRRAGLPA